MVVRAGFGLGGGPFEDLDARGFQAFGWMLVAACAYTPMAVVLRSAASLASDVEGLRRA